MIVTTQEVDARAQCKECRVIRTTKVNTKEIKQWVGGDMVQSVWPDKSPDEREIIMNSQFIDLLGRPFPGPYYLCPPCWDQSMDDMEGYYESTDSGTE